MKTFYLSPRFPVFAKKVNACGGSERQARTQQRRVHPKGWVEASEKKKGGGVSGHSAQLMQSY